MPSSVSSPTIRSTATLYNGPLVEHAPRGVLIVDDDPLSSGLLFDLLSERFGVATKLIVAECLNSARRELAAHPELEIVLLDQHLPDGLGVEFLSELRGRADRISAILLTGAGNERLAASAFLAGACDYLPKIEVDAETLTNSVMNGMATLRKRRGEHRARAELQRLRGEVDHYLRAISHDMGANLMLMAGTVDALKQETAPPDRAAANDGFAHLEACLRQSNKFIGDLVSLARTGTVEMQPQAVRPLEIAEQVVFEQRRLLEQRDIRCDLDPAMPAVMIHPARLKQILTNLMRNAARHGCATTNPHIVVRTAAPPPGETSSDRIWLSVADNGPGIPPEQRDEIFLPGKRLPTAHAEGSGMGLAIVKKIIDHYEGRILVDPLAAGTSFVFSLPRAE